MRFRTTKEEIINHLQLLGVEEGDTLLVRADLGSIGRLSRNKLDYINCLLEVVGPSGTIVGLAFTGCVFFKRDRDKVFDENSKANTGSLANIMLSYPGSIRSKHPSNSYVAIGKQAKYILNKHDEYAGAYDPIKKIIDLNGKMILIGCVQSSPGFTTTHLAEVELGLHKRIIFPTLDTTYYKTLDGSLGLFKRRDLGGCSSSFYKLYGHYIKEEILFQGNVGNAYSVLIDAKKAFQIDLEVLKDNPKFNLCDDLNCFHCRARRWDNISNLPFFVFRKLFSKSI